MIQKVGNVRTQVGVQAPGRGASESFEQVLRQTLHPQSTVQFSAHAKRRMAVRNVTLSPEQLQRLDSAVGQAAAKGLKEPLVLIEDLALVVSVTNRKVITVIKGGKAEQRVFTNIDGAVIG